MMRALINTMRSLNAVPVSRPPGDLSGSASRLQPRLRTAHIRDSGILGRNPPAASCFYRNLSGTASGKSAPLAIDLWMRMLETPLPRPDTLSASEKSDYNLAFLALAQDVVEKIWQPGRAVDVGLKAEDFRRLPDIPGPVSQIRHMTQNLLGVSDGMRMPLLRLDAEGQCSFDWLAVCSRVLLDEYRALPKNADPAELKPALVATMHDAFDDLKTHILRLERSRCS